MKLKLLLAALMFFSLHTFSQDVLKEFGDVKTATIRNIGTINLSSINK